VTLAPTGGGKQHALNRVRRLLQEAGAKHHDGPSEFIGMPAVINLLLRCARKTRLARASGFESNISKILSTIDLALAVVTTSLACAGERDRMKLQQPLVPTPELYCYSTNCMSLSSTVLVSDACYRTCAAQCGGHFETCIGAAVLNNCRFGGDVCDLSCQKRCRAYGGPLLDITGLMSGFTR
jgi:hypothetical protein